MAIVAAKAAVAVQKARHCRVQARYTRKNAGVSLMPAATPTAAPRSRAPPGRVRSQTISSTRKILICPSQMVERTGSNAVHTTASASARIQVRTVSR